jgi:hypothetical protein
MNMQHPNYCRQMIKQFLATISSNGVNWESQRLLSSCVEFAKNSTKFLLPAGGRLFDDLELRALDDTEPLRLPFPRIALEYRRSEAIYPLRAGELACSKAIVLAEETDHDIRMMHIDWVDEHQTWAPMPLVSIPRVNYLRRDYVVNGRVGTMIYKSDASIPDSDYGDGVGALLCLLNALHCSNVYCQRSMPKHATSTPSPSGRGRLPFDSYHILMIQPTAIDGAGAAVSSNSRLPREHLRRGHIRRLSDKRRIWVNATVVAAGSGGGILHKDYGVASPARGSAP